MRVKGPDPTGGFENPCPSVAQLSIPAERQGLFPMAVRQALLTFSRNTAPQPSRKGLATKMASFPGMQIGVCVWMEFPAASCFTNNMHFHARELWVVQLMQREMLLE